MKDKYGKTLIACYLGFITQAIAANFAPLLFLTFKRTYGIPISEIAFISTTFFFTQLLIDLFCAKFVDRIGYRKCVVASEIFSAAGLIGLAILPEILPNAYAGIIIRQSDALFIVGVFWGLEGLNKATNYLNEGLYYFTRKEKFIFPMSKAIIEFVLSSILIFDPFSKIAEHVVILGLELVLEGVSEFVNIYKGKEELLA